MLQSKHPYCFKDIVLYSLSKLNHVCLINIHANRSCMQQEFYQWNTLLFSGIAANLSKTRHECCLVLILKNVHVSAS